MRRRSPWGAMAALAGVFALVSPTPPAWAAPTWPRLPAEAHLFVASAESLPEELIEHLDEHPDIEGLMPASAARLHLDDGELAVVAAEPGPLAALGAEVQEDLDHGLLDEFAQGRLVPAQAAVGEGRLEPGETLSSAVEGRWTLEVADPVESAIPGVAGFLSAERGEDLGMPEANAALLRVSTDDAIAVQEELTALLAGDSGGVQILPGAPGTGAQDEEAAAGAPRWDGQGLDADTVEEAIAAAESKLGAPYVWGGSGPEVFDCSGLVQWAFAQVGVTVPRVTHEQWHAGPQVDYDEARRGDLLFWRSDPDRPDYISHVALYLGEGQMIEAPRRGEVVRVTDVRFDNFAGAVRPSPE